MEGVIYLIFILVGSSGSGKTTIGEQFFGKHREIISFTTRDIRSGERDGIDYFFLTEEEALDKIRTNQVVEYTIYDSNYYGLLKDEFDKKSNTNCYAILDYSGYLNVKKEYPEETIGIFVDIDKELVLQRMLARGDSKEAIKKRLAIFDLEQKNKTKLEHIVINNGDLKKTLKSFKKVVDKYISM